MQTTDESQAMPSQPTILMARRLLAIQGSSCGCDCSMPDHTVACLPHDTIERMNKNVNTPLLQ